MAINFVKYSNWQIFPYALESVMSAESEREIVFDLPINEAFIVQFVLFCLFH